MSTEFSPEPEGLTFLDLAEKVLLETKNPMTYREIWDYAVKHGYEARVGSHGRTPWISLSAQLGTDVRRQSSRFVRTDLYPARWFLRALPPPLPEEEAPATVEVLEEEAEEVALGIPERDYHPLVALFANEQWGAYVKTILHESSRRRGYLRWAHPDLVGFSFEEDWEDPIIELGTSVGSPPIVFFSFEVKRRLDFNNLGEAFFEAVSNSSWAHKGYLAAVDIDDDLEFQEELSRLATAHGIGIIELNADKPEDSNVLIEARHRVDLDWKTVNKLYGINPDFAGFIDAVRRVIRGGGSVRKEDYDTIPPDAKALAASFVREKATRPKPEKPTALPVSGPRPALRPVRDDQT